MDLKQEAGQELHWITDVIPQVIESYNTKIESYSNDLAYLDRMQTKLFCYRDTTSHIVESDRSANLKDLAGKLKRIQESSIEFFGHRQLPYMMKSFFFQQQLVNLGFSIPEYVNDRLQ